MNTFTSRELCHLFSYDRVLNNRFLLRLLPASVVLDVSDTRQPECPMLVLQTRVTILGL
jgi:hypothetical protein